MATQVLLYELNTSNLGADTSGSSLDATNTDVTLVNDPERGNVASFNGSTSKLVLPSVSVPSAITGTGNRSFSVRINHSNVSSRRAFFNSGSATALGRRFRLEQSDTNLLVADAFTSNRIGTTVLQTGTWYHIAAVYNGSNVATYIDGVLEFTWNRTLDTDQNDFIIGEDETSQVLGFSGLMSDFRVYDTNLSAADVLSIANEPVFLSTPWSTFIESSWTSVPGAVAYRVTYSELGSSQEIVTVDSTTELSAVIYNLAPENTYTVNTYSSSDGISFSLENHVDITTLADTSANSNLSHFDNNGVYDMSFLNESTRTVLGFHIDDFLTTGDTLILDVSTIGILDLKYISRGAASTIADTESVILPFDSTGGSSQTANLTLSDNSTVSITYDEVNNEMNIGGTTRSVGDVLIVDGKKLTIHDV